MNFRLTLCVENASLRFIRTITVFCLVILLSGCLGGSVTYSGGEVSGRVEGDLGTVISSSGSADGELIQTGNASWYGGRFHGQATASGEIFNKWDNTAAHRKLPLGTWLIVERVSNGRQVKVKVNDRGPFVEGRIIDLARGAAGELNMVDDGVAQVRLYRIGGPDAEVDRSTGGYFTIQVGSFTEKSNALDLKTKLSKQFDDVHVTYAYDKYHRVRVGKYDSEGEADATSETLRSMGMNTWVVRESSDG